MLCQRIRKFYKFHKTAKITATALFAAVLVFILLCLSSGIVKVEEGEAPGENPYIVDRPLISAHRAGGAIAPENTLSAFEHCLNASSYKVDILEFDLHLTADNVLVLLHDDTLDRTSNSAELFGKKDVKASEKNYSALYELNMAENFQATDGSYPYRGNRGEAIPEKHRILSLNVLFEKLRTNQTINSLSYIIEIKDSGDRGNKAVDILYSLLEQFKITERVILGTFNGSVSKYIDDNYSGKILRSAGIAEVLDFYFCSIFNVDLSKKDIKFSVLQIPYKDFGINLGKKAIVNYAHKYGIAVQYWTINDKKDISYLADIGADAIITDSPDVAYKQLH